MSSPSFPEAVRGQIDDALRNHILEQHGEVPIPVVLTLPASAGPAVTAVEDRIRELGGTVVRVLILAGAVAAEVTTGQLVGILQEFTGVRAGLDTPGELENEAPVDEHKQYLEHELGWSADSVAKVSGGLAQLVAESDMAGLEGVGLPVVVHTTAAQDPFVVGRSADFPDRRAFLDSVAKSNARSVGAVEEHIRAAGLVVGRRLALTGAVTSNMTQEQIRDLLVSREDHVSFAELDTPGALELDVAVPAIEVPLIDPALGLDGAGQVVAVIDGEIAPHPALGGRVKQMSSFAKFGWGESPDDAGEQLAQSHSTAVATIIAGDGTTTSGPSPRVGVAPRAAIWNYKIAPATKRGSDVAAALEKAFSDGARIINLSWGKKDADADGNSVWSRTVDALFAQGVLVCKSAGNEGPAAKTITVPADSAKVLAVGAADRAGSALQDGSSRGPTADGRAKPDVIAPGGGTVAGNTSGGYEATSAPGTSFAAPFAAGLAALLWQHKPDATVSEIRDAILASCRPLAGPGPSEQGMGVISAARAVAALQ